MNALEKIALKELRNEVQEILDKSHQSNSESFQHCRLHLRANAERAMQIIKAIEENSNINP